VELILEIIRCRLSENWQGLYVIVFGLNLLLSYAAHLRFPAPPIGPSWTLGYVGLGFTHDIISAPDACLCQYSLSLYWVTTTLSSSGLIAGMTPSSWSEIGFTCFAMLVSLTLYSYVLGELSNVVMKGDEALVHQRSQLSLVQVRSKF
jgi:hypothetical protein